MPGSALLMLVVESIERHGQPTVGRYWSGKNVL